jgi:UDP-N-acetylglucosamine 3-dehydrogenase
MLHARVYHENPATELVALCTRNTSRLQRAGEALGVRKLYTDYRELLRREENEIDVVSIATPDSTHAEIANMALSLDKNVFLEKPMCSTLEEADAIIENSRKSKGKIMVDFILRFDPRYIEAKEIVERGSVGKILALHTRRHASSDFAKTQGRYSNLFRSSTVHDIDIMLWLTSAFPSRVYATGNRSISIDGASDDSVLGILEFKDRGIVGSLDANWVLPTNFPSQLESELRIVGESGVVDVTGQNQGLEEIASDGLRRPDLSFWPDIQGRIGGALRDAVTSFVSCIATNKNPPAGPQEGKNALRVALALEESARTHLPVELKW